MISIRKAKKEDVDGIFDVFLHLAKAEDMAASRIGSDWKRFRTRRPDFDRSVNRDIRKAVLDRKRRFIVATKGREIVGYAIGDINPTSSAFFVMPKSGHLAAIAVKKGHQGEGIGSALHKDMLAWFRKRGCISVMLDVFPTNPATSIYKRWRYAPIVNKMMRKL